MARTKQQQLDDLDAMIAAAEAQLTTALGTEEWSEGQQRTRQAQLDRYYAERRRLEGEAAAEASSGNLAGGAAHFEYIEN